MRMGYSTYRYAQRASLSFIDRKRALRLKLRFDGAIEGRRRMRTVIFLHIPKAAGSTLHAVLRRKYPKHQIYDVSTAQLPAFHALPLQRRAELALVKGHMPFGIHEHIPNDFTYITLLRDPVERAISHYYYVLRRTTHNLHDRMKRMELEDYVTSGITHEMDNGQVRLLSGHDDDLPFGGCGEQHLREAIGNLREHFSVVGLAERFEESLLLMQHALGWITAPYYVKRNARLGRAPEIPAAVRRRIADVNRFDIALYDYGRALFEAQTREVPHLERRHRSYRRRMTVVGPCLAIGDRMGRKIRARLAS